MENAETITPEQVEALRQRLGEESTPRKSWLHPCPCDCGCTVMHPSRTKACILCRDDDHWGSLDEILEKITVRQVVRLTASLSPTYEKEDA